MDDWLKAAIGGAVGGIFVLIAAVATSWFSFASKDEELRVHLVEIAMGILRADPSKEDVAPARAWALDAIDKASGLRPFTEEERAALLHKPLGFADSGYVPGTFLKMQQYFDTHPGPWNGGVVK
jgi:hypothetical protein